MSVYYILYKISINRERERERERERFITWPTWPVTTSLFFLLCVCIILERQTDRQRDRDLSHDLSPYLFSAECLFINYIERNVYHKTFLHTFVCVCFSAVCLFITHREIYLSHDLSPHLCFSAVCLFVTVSALWLIHYQSQCNRSWGLPLQDMPITLALSADLVWAFISLNK